MVEAEVVVALDQVKKVVEALVVRDHHQLKLKLVIFLKSHKVLRIIQSKKE